MAKTNYRSIDDYLASQAEPVQRVLDRVRRIVRKTVPDAEEAISCQIPVFKLHGRPMLYFAGWKEHYSLYPSSDRIVKAFKKELAPYKLSKGTIRFPLSAPVPGRLIAGIAKLRAQDVVEREQARQTTKKVVAKKR